jgi:hypothetical protein
MSRPTSRTTVLLQVLVLLAPLALGAAGSAACSGEGAEPGLGESESSLDCRWPRPGCPCAEEGVRVVCGEEVGSPGGQVVCGRGESTCAGGTWGACDIQDSVTLHPGLDPETKGSPVDCPNPCDPYCHTFNDDPTGECDKPNGICEGNGGITLPGTDGSSGTPPCKGGKSGTCAHTICEPGAALADGCDGTATPPPPPATEVTEDVLVEPFANNSQGWSLGPEWQIGPAKSSFGQVYGYGDPSTDTTPTGDNGVAGVNIGGNASTALHGYYYLTSPVRDTSKYDVSLELSFSRMLNSDYPPFMTNRVEVFNGTSWVVLYQSAFPGPTDAGWSTLKYDVFAYRNASFQVRFGFMIGSGGVFKVASWSLDDVVVKGTRKVTSSGSPVKVLEEGFANNSQGWTLGPEWQIGSAKSSTGHVWGYGDPAIDNTPTADNGVAGVNIGGNASKTLHGYYYLTSPVRDTSKYDVSLELSYARWLDSDYPPFMTNRVEVFNGSSWVVLYESAHPGPIDSSWTTVKHDVLSYRNANFQVRFGFMIGSSGVYTVASWNLDDVTIVGTKSGSTPPPPTTGGCVSQICKASPGCCSTGWTASCVAMVKSVCGVQCLCTTAGEFVGCYNDNLDHDGDGYTGLDGDCLDCDPYINAGAYDFANAIDDDCNGVIDDEVSVCDSGLPMTTSNPIDHAKAIDLCRTTTASDTGKNKHWGVFMPTETRLVQADGVSNVHSLSYGILSQFGPNNKPFKGSKLAVYSSGTARAPGDPSYVNPSGQYASFSQGMSCPYPPGYPVNKLGCPTSGSYAYDSSGALIKIRVPTNAKSFSYKFHFFSSEYPEWVCTAFNDHFVALMKSVKTNKNISYDSQNNPVSVNISLFTIPGCSTCSHMLLTSTGFDGWCGGQTCGGSTDWLETKAPVTPGEVMTIQFSVWDMGDHVWDSSVLIDNWIWSPQDTVISTGKVQPPQPTTYSDGYFIRDYDASGICQEGTRVVWDLWSWKSGTPTDSYIDFAVATATTKAGLSSATKKPILFTAAQGPAALVGTQAKAAAAPVNTQNGSALVDTALATGGLQRDLPFLRVVSHLAPSADKLKAPTLTGWNLTFHCEIDQ